MTTLNEKAILELLEEAEDQESNGKKLTDKEWGEFCRDIRRMNSHVPFTQLEAELAEVKLRYYKTAE